MAHNFSRKVDFKDIDFSTAYRIKSEMVAGLEPFYPNISEFLDKVFDGEKKDHEVYLVSTDRFVTGVAIINTKEQKLVSFYILKENRKSRAGADLWVEIKDKITHFNMDHQFMTDHAGFFLNRGFSITGSEVGLYKRHRTTFLFTKNE